jgi:hypothetical protein
LHRSEEVAVTGPYDGVHAFLFLQEKDATPASEVIAAIQGYIGDEGPVFFARVFEGGFTGFVHFAADDLEGLVEFAGTVLFDAGVRSNYTTEGSILSNTNTALPMGPKRQSPRFCAICRVRTTQRPGEVLAAIAQAFDQSEPLVGASRVIGTFPLLVELGSDSEQGLNDAIDRLRRVEGVDEDIRVGTVDTEQEADQGSSA